jgi:hypothetical protein
MGFFRKLSFPVNINVKCRNRQYVTLQKSVAILLNIIAVSASGITFINVNITAQNAKSIHNIKKTRLSLLFGA